MAAKQSFVKQRSYRGVRLGVFAIEKKRAGYRRLRASLDDFERDGVLVESRNGDWTQFVPDILKHAGGSPIFVFADPFGFKGLDMKAMTPLLSRREPTDLLMRLEDQATHRLAKDYSSVLSTAVGGNNWLTTWNAVRDPAKRLAAIYAELEHNVRLGLGPQGTVKSHKFHPLGTRRSSFTMLLASRKMDALRIWDDKVAKYQRSQQRERASIAGEQLVLGEAQSYDERRISGIESEIIKYLRQQPNSTWGSIRDHFILWYDAPIEDKELSDGLRVLVDNGTIIHTDASRRAIKQGRYRVA